MRVTIQNYFEKTKQYPNYYTNEEQQALVEEGQAILRKYGIDPIVGSENLVWAPNAVTGQHSIESLEKVVEGLKAVDEAGGDYDDIVNFLEDMGQIASSRG